MQNFNIDNIELMKDLESQDFTTRWFAAEVLGTKRDLTQEQIKKVMSLMPKSDVGEVLVWGLGQMDNKKGMKLISNMLEHKNNYYKWRAAVALRDISNDKARMILEKHLNTSDSEETRWRCAAVLGDMGSMKSFSCLWKHLTDKDRFVRWKSVGAIATLKGDVESKVKQKLTSSKLTPFLAWRSFWILGQIGNSETAKWIDIYLKKYFTDNLYVRYQGILATENIKNK